MMALTPYSGSLLRLALTTVAILAVFAVVLALWQENADALHRGAARQANATSVIIVSPRPGR